MWGGNFKVSGHMPKSAPKGTSTRVARHQTSIPCNLWMNFLHDFLFRQAGGHQRFG